MAGGREKGEGNGERDLNADQAVLSNLDLLLAMDYREIRPKEVKSKEEEFAREFARELSH